VRHNAVQCLAYIESDEFQEVWFIDALLLFIYLFHFFISL
jgi:hypothetical protein